MNARMGIVTQKGLADLIRENFGVDIGLISTIIEPWMQFYMQSSVIEKGIKIYEYKYVVMVNKKDLMGEYVNNKFKNWVGWITIIILIALTIVLLFQAIIQILGF